MTTNHIPVAIIGGGRPGSVSWYLGRMGVEHVVLEAQTPVRTLWPTPLGQLTLVTPNWHCKLPGYAYTGPGTRRLHDPRRGGGLAGRLDTFTPPLRTHTRVTWLAQGPDGGSNSPRRPGDAALRPRRHATGGYPLP